MGRMLGGLAILLVFLLAGEAISGLGFLLPGNVTGMLLLTGAFALRIIRVDQVRRASDALLDNLAFFFVPPAVGVALHLDLIRGNWPAIGAALVIGTAAVLVTVGVVAQLAMRRVDARGRSPGRER